MSQAELRCIEAIRSGSRTKTAIALRSKLDLRRAAKALDLLIADGLIVATGRQSWQLTPLGETFGNHTSVEAELRMRMRRERDIQPGTTAHRLIGLLDRPRRGSELAQVLGVSRQRVHQLIVKLAASDQIRLGDPDHPMHAIAGRADPTLLLTIEEERVFSVLPPSGQTTQSRIRAAVAMEAAEVERLLGRLVALGLAEITRNAKGEARYGLAAAGAAHWQRADSIRFADPPPLPVRSDRVRMVLSYFDQNGPTRTIKVGQALGISRNSINALMQYLKRKKLVRKAAEAQNAPHELTPNGRDTLNQMGRGA